MQTLIENPIVSLIIIAWVLPWTGIALWKAAKRDDNIWFIVMLIVNTLGILEIFYIFVVAGERSFWQKTTSKVKGFFNKI